jgi:predicted ATPase
LVIGGLPPPGEPVSLAIKEKDLPGAVEQHTVSQGMFRALSLIIQLNFGLMSRRAACILVDDIGEGLDFERSCAIIDLLRRKARDSAVQLIMSTNDRFVMNKVPLEEWCLLQRTGNKVCVRNYRNSKEAFDRFKVTGLNNFDFLATDFIDKV